MVEALSNLMEKMESLELKALLNKEVRNFYSELSDCDRKMKICNVALGLD